MQNQKFIYKFGKNSEFGVPKIREIMVQLALALIKPCIVIHIHSSIKLQNSYYNCSEFKKIRKFFELEAFKIRWIMIQMILALIKPCIFMFIHI